MVILSVLGGGLIALLMGVAAYSRVGRLSKKIDELELELAELRVLVEGRAERFTKEAPAPARSATPASPVTAAPRLPPPPAVVPAPEARQPDPSVHPPLSAAPPMVTAPSPEKTEPEKTAGQAKSSYGVLGKPKPPVRTSWEQFAGVKLFAWLGGLALFFAVIFFIKYSFDQGLISPPLRIAFGSLFGIACIVGGLRLERDRYAITIQALTASGLAVLYGNLFAAHSLYGLLGSNPTFALMTLVTLAAFVLAVRLDARYVAAMGLLGGFLTPPLVSSGIDRPFGLFGYIALLDVGLAAVVWRMTWGIFLPLSAFATVIMEWGWFETHFAESKAIIGSAIFLFFPIAYTAIVRAMRSRGLAGQAECAAFLSVISALGFALSLVADYAGLSASGTLVLTVIVAASSILIGIQNDSLSVKYMIRGTAIAGFVLLALWTDRYLSDATMHKALAAFLVFGAAQFLASTRRVSSTDAPTTGYWGIAVPAAILLALFPPLTRGLFSPVFWPAVFLVNILGLVAAALAGVAAGAYIFIILTMLMIVVWIGSATMTGGLFGMLLIIILFSALFIAASLLRTKLATVKNQNFDYSMLLAAAMPFLLLIVADGKIRPPDPSPLFVVALLLNALLAALVIYHCVDIAAPAALAGTFLLLVFHQSHSPLVTPPMTMIAWECALPLLYLLAAILFRERVEGRRLPWTTAVLAGPLFFYAHYDMVVREFGTSWIGLAPAAWSIPYMAALAWLQKRPSGAAAPTRHFQLASVAAIALFFVTLIFPLQFEKQWITISWAFEALALVLLYPRIPHPGLLYWSTALLAICFARLTANPEIFTYARGPQPLFLNWFAYTYLTCAAVYFTTGRRLRRCPELYWTKTAGAFAIGAGVVLLFYYMNIEIGHAYREDASRAFSLSGSVARDMTYSIAWSLFACALMIVGIRRNIRPARLSGIGLLAVTCLKVFLHDLWLLSQLYRVGSFAGLAVILIFVSYLYQKYASGPRGENSGNET